MATWIKRKPSRTTRRKWPCGKASSRVGARATSDPRKPNQASKGGDVAAIRLIIERLIPPLKAVDAPLSIQLPEGGLSLQGRAIIASAALGEVSPADASQLLGAIGQLARIQEFDALVERVEKLEALT